jgi:PEP-CTERM motif
MRLRCRTAFGLLLVGLAVTCAAPRPAAADPIVQAFTRADITPNDLIDWGQFGANGTAVTGPAAGTSTGGLGFTIDEADHNLLRIDQGAGWDGNFAPGDRLMTSQAFVAVPMILSFSSPVNGAAFQIQRDAHVPFTASLDVFAGPNATGTLLASFTRAGVSNGNADNSAIVLGGFDSGGGNTIGSLRFTTSPSDGQSDFAINQVSLHTAAVPEPSTLALTGLGMLGMAAWLRRRKKRG